MPLVGQGVNDVTRAASVTVVSPRLEDHLATKHKANLELTTWRNVSPIRCSSGRKPNVVTAKVVLECKYRERSERITVEIASRSKSSVTCQRRIIFRMNSGNSSSPWKSRTYAGSPPPC
eukprot:6459382-Amphidinium_carterae.1